MKFRKSPLFVGELEIFYGQGTRTMAALADKMLAKTSLVMNDFIYPFLASAF